MNYMDNEQFFEQMMERAQQSLNAMQKTLDNATVTVAENAAVIENAAITETDCMDTVTWDGCSVIACSGQGGVPELIFTDSDGIMLIVMGGAFHVEVPAEQGGI